MQLASQPWAASKSSTGSLASHRVSMAGFFLFMHKCGTEFEMAPPPLGVIMDELRKLIEKKKYWGFLSGRDALIFRRRIESRVDGSAGKWTQKDFQQL